MADAPLQEGCIIIARLEDNMFDPNRSKTRRQTDESVHSFIPMLPATAPFYVEFASITVMVTVIGQLAVGYLANSMALLSDAARQVADQVEVHRYNRGASPTQRMIEVISICVVCVFLLVISVAFIVTASSRASVLNFEMNKAFLIIGTVLSFFTNSVQLMVHLLDWNRPSVSATMKKEGTSHRSQLLHGTINHGLALVVLANTVLYMISPTYLLADSVATYILVLLIVSNVAAASTKCYKEYQGLEYARDEYEEI